MKPIICQCCGRTFSLKMRGTTRDHRKSLDYCLNCLRDGVFLHPHFSILDMEKKLLKMARYNDELCLEEAEAAIKNLPDLKRWKRTHIL